MPASALVPSRVIVEASSSVVAMAGPVRLHSVLTARSGLAYFEPDYHRSNSSRVDGKTRWIVPMSEHFLLFDKADCDGWSDQATVWQQHELWSLAVEPIGEGRRRLAKFPRPANECDPWHGYPVHSREAGGRPSDSKIASWVTTEVISYRDSQLLRRGRL
jgi:hypothetical protein